MISIALSAFAILLALGCPISTTILIASAIGIAGVDGNAMPVVQQLHEGLNSYTLLAIPFFIISGNLAANGGTSTGIVDVIDAFLGRLRGGLGIATILACIFFGAVTGSAVATVVAIGTLMLPKLIGHGYPKLLSIGIITASGTLGVMIPPSIPMLQISVVMGSSVSKQFLAGFLPGILLAIGFSVYTFIIAHKLKIPLEAKKSFHEKVDIIKKGIPALIFPIIILGGIYSGLATITEAAIISLFYVLLVELFFYRKMDMHAVVSVIKKSAVDAAVITMTVAAVRAFVWYLTTQRVPAAVFAWITSNVGNRYIFLLWLVILLFCIGCFVDVINVVVILGPVLLQSLQYFDIDPIHFGIIAVICAQIGFISPPFGVCLFVAMRVGNASLSDVVKGSFPFVLIMAAFNILFILVPDICMLLPNVIQ